jgi:hypothetical protein
MISHCTTWQFLCAASDRVHKTGPDPRGPTIVFTSLSLLSNAVWAHDQQWNICGSCDGTHAITSTDFKLITLGFTSFCGRSSTRRFHPLVYGFGEGEREIVVIHTFLNLKIAFRAKSPKRLWDHCGQWIAAIRRFTAHPYPEVDGMTPYKRVHARTGDISAYAQFDWYQYVWYIDPVPSDTAQSKRKIERWIGVAEDIGGPLTYLILPASAIPVPRSSVFPVTTAEMMSEEVKQLMMELDNGINDHIGDERTDQQIMQEMPDAGATERHI